MVQIPQVKICIRQVQNHGTHTKERGGLNGKVEDHAGMKKSNISERHKSPCSHNT